jgi:hypothetical protein
MKRDMPVRPIESGPLTDREIEELDALLPAEDSLENPMDFYTFDGFICALLSGPNTIMPSEWLRWVWDQGGGERRQTSRCIKLWQPKSALLPAVPIQALRQACNGLHSFGVQYFGHTGCKAHQRCFGAN